MKPKGTRGNILEAALRLFAERGYAGASMRDISSACGIKAATVYSHYPSKGHILAELCRLGLAEHARLIRAALLAAGSEPLDQITAVVRAHVAMHTTHPMLAVVSNGELHHLPTGLSPHIFEMRDQTIQLFSEIIQRGVDLQAFDVPDVWLATAAIGGMGLRVAFWFDPDGDVDPDSVADAYAQFAQRLLQAKPRTEIP